jgi:hypothetical protein
VFGGGVSDVQYVWRMCVCNYSLFTVNILKNKEDIYFMILDFVAQQYTYYLFAVIVCVDIFGTYFNV